MLESRRHRTRLCIDCAGNESFDSWSQSSDSTGSDVDAIAARLIPNCYAWQPRQVQQEARPQPRPPDNLQRFAEKLRTILPSRGTTFTQAAKLMKNKPGFKDALSMARMSFAAFVSRFPSLVIIRNAKLYGGTQTTLG